jgi:hypothetical protein
MAAMARPAPLFSGRMTTHEAEFYREFDRLKSSEREAKRAIQKKKVQACIAGTGKHSGQAKGSLPLIDLSFHLKYRICSRPQLITSFRESGIFISSASPLFISPDASRFPLSLSRSSYLIFAQKTAHINNLSAYSAGIFNFTKTNKLSEGCSLQNSFWLKNAGSECGDRCFICQFHIPPF